MYSMSLDSGTLSSLVTEILFNQFSTQTIDDLKTDLRFVQASGSFLCITKQKYWYFQKYYIVGLDTGTLSSLVTETPHIGSG